MASIPAYTQTKNSSSIYAQSSDDLSIWDDQLCEAASAHTNNASNTLKSCCPFRETLDSLCHFSDEVMVYNPDFQRGKAQRNPSVIFSMIKNYFDRRAPQS